MTEVADKRKTNSTLKHAVLQKAHVSAVDGYTVVFTDECRQTIKVGLNTDLYCPTK